MIPLSVPRMYLFVTFTTALLMGGVLSAKIIDIAGFAVPGGAVIFPLTFSCLVIVSEVYGLEQSWRLAQAGVIMLFLCLVAAYVVVHAPNGPFARQQAGAFSLLFNIEPPTLGVVPLAFALGESVGLLVYRYAALDRSARTLWIRLIVVPMTSQCVTSFTFLVIAFHRDATRTQLAEAISARLVFAAIFAVATSWVLWLVINRIKRRELIIIPKDLRYGR